MVAVVRGIRQGQGAGRGRADPSAPARPQAARARRMIGTMVEVPSLLFQLDELLERVDFLSVGSNDLMQFLYAADRGNPRVSRPLRPAVGAGAARAQGHRRQGAASTASRWRCAANSRRSRSARWRSSFSAIARCRCRRPRSARSRRCCSNSIAARAKRNASAAAWSSRSAACRSAHKLESFAANGRMSGLPAPLIASR